MYEECKRTHFSELFYMFDEIETTKIFYKICGIKGLTKFNKLSAGLHRGNYADENDDGINDNYCKGGGIHRNGVGHGSRHNAGHRG